MDIDYKIPDLPGKNTIIVLLVIVILSVGLLIYDLKTQENEAFLFELQTRQNIEENLMIIQKNTLLSMANPLIIQRPKAKLIQEIEPKVKNNILKSTIPPVIKIERKKVLAIVTAFTARVEETDNEPCIAASGKDVCKYPEQVIACPPVLEFGQIVSINGQEFICHDRMNIRFRQPGDWHFDILKTNLSEARKFGRQVKEVVIY